jgi:predicted AAA+ superfamily ATPase
MIKRELYLKRIRPFYNSEMIKVITGIRRCGKSVLMKQIIEELISRDVDKGCIIYINFEDYQYNKINTPDALYEYINSQITKEKKYYLLIDEIQNVNEFELVINSFRSTHDISIFITGSNSKLLSGELASHLSGRTVSFKVLPFSYAEFCSFKKVNGELSDKQTLLNEYLTWGGFPLVCNENDGSTKSVILSNIYDSVVLKDIIMRNKVASVNALEKVLDYLISNSSVTISGNKIAAALTDLNQKVSAPTVYDYIRYIEEACICDKVSRYDIRGKKLLAYEEKIYVCDLGLFKMKKNPNKDEYNYIIETVCYNELISRGYKVYVGNTFKGEIDFIAQKGDQKIYIQAAYLLSNDDVVKREFGAYDNVQDNYPKYVVSMDPITRDRDGIIHINLEDFLLNKKEIFT